MLAQPIDLVLMVWFALSLLSTAYVAYDQFTRNPEGSVMKWGFVLITLYMGPFGLLLYVLADKEPAPGTHEEFIKPLWKQSAGSTIHCCAGDATGIIVAAAITALLGLPMWIDLIVEYTAGFLFGLFIFQSLFMRRIMGGTYLENVRRMFVPELISMNMMMAGMAPVMSLLMMGRDMRAMQPTELLFWGVMSIGVIVGFAFAFPANVWMVMRKLKHGLMTERSTARSPKVRAHEQSGAAAGHAATPADHSMLSDTTRPQLATVTGITLLFLVAGMVMPALLVNLRLGARDVGSSIMPPGMIMSWDTPAAAMRDMSAVLPRYVSYVAAPDAHGDASLSPRIENGVKVFDLETSVIRWTILPRVTVEAYAFNRQVPGPRIRVTEGDRIRST